MLESASQSNRPQSRLMGRLKVYENVPITSLLFDKRALQWAEELHSPVAQELLLLGASSPSYLLTLTIFYAERCYALRDDPRAYGEFITLLWCIEKFLQSSGQFDSLPENVRKIANAYSSSSSVRSHIVNEEGLRFYKEYHRSGLPAMLDGAIENFANAVHSDPSQEILLSNYAEALRYRYEKGGAPEDIHLAVKIAELSRKAAQGPLSRETSGNLGLAYAALYNDTEDSTHLDSAVFWLKKSALAANYPAEANRLLNLARPLLLRFERAGLKQDLLDAEQCLRLARRLKPVSGKSNISFAIREKLATALKYRFDLLSDDGALNEALCITQALRVAVLTYGRNMEVPSTNLALLYSLRYERTGNLSDIGFAALYGRASVLGDHSSPGGTELCNFALILASRYHLTGEAADLEGAIEFSERAISAQENAPLRERLPPVGNLAFYLYRRFQLDGHRRDLDLAEQLGREAVTSTSTHDLSLPDRLTNLANILRTRAEQTGSLHVLQESISNSRLAVETSVNRPWHGRYLANLAVSLQARFVWTNHRSSLITAVTAMEDAVSVTPASDPEYSSRLHNLSNMYLLRYGELSDTEDLANAVDGYRRCLQASNLEAVLAVVVRISLSAALIQLYESEADPEVLAEARTILEALLHENVSRSSEADLIHGNLSSIYLLSYIQTHNLAYLDDAIEHGGRAVRRADSQRGRTSLWALSLADVLLRRASINDSETDISSAILLLENASTALGASMPAHLKAARTLGQLGWRLGRVDVACRGYARAVETLQKIAGAAPDDETRRRHLKSASMLAEHAAACHLHAADPIQSLELLEAGRAVLWSRQLSFTPEITALAKLDRSLYLRMREIGQQMARPEDASSIINIYEAIVS